MIRLENINYTYPATDSPVLQQINLHIPENQFCAVIGANGAGKSTLAYTIAGYVPHFFHGEIQGKVIVGDYDTQQTPLHKLVLQTGLIFQNPFNQISGTKFTVREEIAFGLENLGIEPEFMANKVDEVMKLVGISHLGERSPLALSGGQMQRVAIASVLAMQPRVLLLDEPTAQLDPIGSREVFETVRNLVRQGGTTVVMIEHKLEWVAEFADRVIVMVEGTIVMDGNPREILSNPRLLEYGTGTTRYTLAGREAQSRNRWCSDIRLPVTLAEAAEGFRVLPWK